MAVRNRRILASEPARFCGAMKTLCRLAPKPLQSSSRVVRAHHDTGENSLDQPS